MSTLENSVNNLLHYLYDSYNGLIECSEQAQSAELKSSLSALASTRNNYIQEIKTAVPSNTDLTDRGTALGPFHRMFIDIKTFITDNNTKAIKEEILRGDKTLVTTYNETIEKVQDEKLKTILSNQLQKIHNDLNETLKVS